MALSVPGPLSSQTPLIDVCEKTEPQKNKQTEEKNATVFMPILAGGAEACRWPDTLGL